MGATIIGLGVWFGNDQYFITNKKIIALGGFFSTETTSVDLIKIRNIEISQGIIEKVFGLGSIDINFNTRVKEIQRRHKNQMLVDEIHTEEGSDQGLLSTKSISISKIASYLDAYKVLIWAKQSKVKEK